MMMGCSDEKLQKKNCRRYSEKEVGRIIDANGEGYRAIEKGGNEILPSADKNYLYPSYRRTCSLFYKLISSTPLGKISVSDHSMHAFDDMSALNRDLTRCFEEVGAEYGEWKKEEKSAKDRGLFTL